MSNSTTHTQAGNSTLHWLVAALLALILLGLWLTGCGPGGSKCNPAAAVSGASAVSAVAAPAAAIPAAASVVSVVPAVASSIPSAKVFFAVDRTELPTDADKSLADVVAYLKANAGSKASISGYHDPSGNLAHNLELAKKRAQGVQGALVKAGIAQDSTVLRKPAQTTGTGDAAEARRVEVSILKP